MKRLSTRYTIPVVVIALSGLASCISDDSKEGNRPLSTITVAKTVEDVYQLDRWDTLRIDAPAVTQAHVDKPLQYRWEINGKVISTEKDLVYECKEYGNFLCRLKISNEDATYFKTFNLAVQYSYRDGLYAAAEDDGKTILTYVPLDGKRQPERDILQKNNPNFTFTGAPQSLTVSYSARKHNIFISIGSPSRVYKFDGNTMGVIGYNEGKKTSSFVYAFYDGRVNNPTMGSAIYVIEDGKFCNISNSTLSVILTNLNARRMETYIPKVNLASQAVDWTRRADDYYNGTAFYDNNVGRFCAFAREENEDSKQYRTLFDNAFAGLRLIGMGAVDNHHEIALFLKDTLTTQYYHVWIDPGAYDAYSSTRNADPELKFKGAITGNIGLNDNSQVIGIPSKNLVYYSSGNKLYAYSVLSKGNYPTSPTLTCDTGEDVASMVVDNEDKYLYVAANNTTTGTGNIYCFDLNSRTRVWKKADVSGKIKQMALRSN